MANKLKLSTPQQSRGDETLLQWQPPSASLQSEPRARDVVVSGTRDAARAGDAADDLQVSAPGLQPAALQPGDIVGDRYVIEEHISSGSFGAVYRASDRQIQNHQVALKLLHTPAADEPAREAALRELTLIASVSHPTIVQFKDYGWREGRLWFAMPWYRGQTLAERFSDSAGPLPMNRVAARPIFERLAQGLAAMHEVGIHHHDIKPENIFLADIAGFEVGFPVLLDLGIATKRGEGPKGLTLEYAAPETAATALGVKDKPVGSAADVYSLALVLHNMLDPASAPSQEGEFVALLNQRATLAVKPSKRRDLRHMRAAFQRWLSLDPDVRPSASEFAAELELLTKPEDQRAARKRILRRVLPIVLASALAVTLLLLQVKQQKTEILVQRERLTQEMQQTEQLRERSAAQLQEIEEKSEQIGSQAQRLQRAIAIGRTLNAQLAKAEDRSDSVTRKLRTTTEQRDALNAERDALSRERDDLRQVRDRTQRERDAAAAARDALAQERDKLRGERDRLSAEREELRAARDAELSRRERLAAELENVADRLRRMTAERDAARDQQQSLGDEIKQLRRRIRGLEKQRGRRASRDQAEASEPPPAPF
jgi:eukaryotic-like serine/threonine-protein kinase